MRARSTRSLRVASEGHPALLHGFPQTGLVWQRQIEASAAHGYRVVTLDQRGYSPGAHPQRPEDIASAFPWRRGHDHRGTGLGGIRPSAMTEIDRRRPTSGGSAEGPCFGQVDEAFVGAYQLVAGLLRVELVEAEGENAFVW